MTSVLRWQTPKKASSLSSKTLVLAAAISCTNIRQTEMELAVTGCTIEDGRLGSKSDISPAYEANRRRVLKPALEAFQRRMNGTLDDEKAKTLFSWLESYVVNRKFYPVKMAKVLKYDESTAEGQMKILRDLAFADNPDHLMAMLYVCSKAPERLDLTQLTDNIYKQLSSLVKDCADCGNQVLQAKEAVFDGGDGGLESCVNFSQFMSEIYECRFTSPDTLERLWTEAIDHVQQQK